MKEKKYRIEDALNATKAAVEEGVVPGGGLALAIACYGNDFAGFEKEMKDANSLSAGVKIINQSVLEPIRQIVSNAGVDGSLILQRIIEENKSTQEVRGYNAANGEFVDMIKEGIVDPTKVVRSALENAASAAMMFLTTEVVITDKPEAKDDHSNMGSAMTGMGMM
jgi:chaperonin GroEL